MQTDEKSKESVLNNFVFQNHILQQVHFFKDEYRNMCYQRHTHKKKDRKKEREREREKEEEKKHFFLTFRFWLNSLTLNDFDELYTCTPSIQVRCVWLLKYSLLQNSV